MYFYDGGAENRHKVWGDGWVECPGAAWQGDTLHYIVFWLLIHLPQANGSHRSAWGQLLPAVSFCLGSALLRVSFAWGQLYLGSAIVWAQISIAYG